MTTFVNVILPDGVSFLSADAKPTTDTTEVVRTVEHETVHQTDELEVQNVFDAVHDEAFDNADTSTADPNARMKQALDRMPRLVNGSRFIKKDHANDDDPTTDSSSISMYRTVYLEPPPNKPAGFPPPTLFTSGTVCTVGEGCFAYIPYNADGTQKDDTRYVFGRAEEIGDRSHDNDGLLMQMTEKYGLTGESIHRLHMSPNPSDPFLLVKSNRNRSLADFIQIYGQGAEVDLDPEDTVFRLDSAGRIRSDQVDTMNQKLDSLALKLGAIMDAMDALKDHVDRIGRAVDIAPLPATEWNLPYND